MHEHEVSGRPTEDTRGEGRNPDRGASGRVLPRRRARGPRPVRPGVVAVAVRPPEAERPQLVRRVRRAEPPRGSRQRLLAQPVAHSVRRAGRGVLAGLAVTAAAAAVVVGLGMLAGTVSHREVHGEVAEPAAQVVAVTVDAEATVWEVARRVAPQASGPELAAVAERIVTDNSLTTVRLHPGQVLRVAAG